MPEYLCYNGRFYKNNEAIIGAENRGLRYGDGIFETIKVQNAVILLADFHMERLFAGLKALQFEIPAHFHPAYILEQILSLCTKNKLRDARVRLSVFRGDGSLYDPVNHKPNLLIQAWPLPPQVGTLNENGLVIGVYDGIQKSCDPFSNLKSANFLPYVMGARFAKDNKLNDALLLNTNSRIADSTIANVFCLINDRIITPSLNEGCVAGVMRRYLLLSLKNAGYHTEETSLTMEAMKGATEIFLTNAISGIRWVKQFEKKNYSNQLSSKLFQQFIAQQQ